jgi:2-C-methyl-D-erythritol 4-phosphate cytidylyltransferase/2-C-methyl-D-erythritol 2,4-cyclodiphosphate synthase
LHDTTLILLAAGNASRFGMPVKKQWLYTASRPLWLDVAKRFEKVGIFETIVVVGAKEELSYMRAFEENYRYTAGGSERQYSLRNALEEVRTPYVMVHDVARCCVSESLVRRVWEARRPKRCVVPALPVSDTLYQEDKPLPREKVRIIQTPQLSDAEMLRTALRSDTLFTDDSSVVRA